MLHRHITLLGVLALAVGFLIPWRPAWAQPVEYVKICNAFGTGYFYIPGTATCVNADTGATGNPDTATYGQTTLAQRVENLEQMFDNDFAEGSAIAIAMPTPFIQEGHHFAIAGNWGTLEGAHALALAGAVRVTDHLSFSAGVGMGVQRSNVGAKAGFNLSW
jgi:hypothetical protein